MLETVSLHGEGFTSHVKEGDKVTSGQLVAEVDIELLKAKKLNTVTPVLICSGGEGLEITENLGEVKAGESVLLTLRKENEAAEEAPRKLIRRKINILAHLANGRRIRDNIIIKTVTQIRKICQYIILRKLSHPASVHHTQIICSFCVCRVQRNKYSTWGVRSQE